MTHTAKDPVTTTTIDYAHKHVHMGITMQASYKSPEGSDVADNANVTLAIFTGRRYSHTAFEFHAGGDCEICLYEGASLSGNGTPLSGYNMLRDSIFTPTTRVTHTPSITTNGILLHNSLSPGGTGNFSGGTVARIGSEWILAPDKTYLVQAINRGGSSQPMSIVVQWYEEEPK